VAQDHNAVLIVTPLPLEFRAMRAHLEGASPDYHPMGTYFMVGRISQVPGRVVLVSPGDGNLDTAVLVERGIERYRPRALLVVGIAGSLKADVEIGDVVVSTWVHAYHGGKEDGSGFAARPRSRAAAHRFSQVAVAVSLEDDWSDRLMLLHGRRPQVHHKPIAAGEVVLNSREAPLAKQIKRHNNDAVAIEMESAGSAAAAHLNDDLPTLTIRGISDLADGEKHVSDAGGFQPAAAEHAAAFAVAFLRELPKAEAAARGGAHASGPAPGQVAAQTEPSATKIQNVWGGARGNVYAAQARDVIGHFEPAANNSRNAGPLPSPISPTWRLLGTDLPVRWLSELDRTAPGVLEVHLVPVSQTSRLEMRHLDSLGVELAQFAREHSLFTSTEALRPFTTSACSGVASVDSRSAAGLAVTRSGQRSIWSALPKDTLGSVLDEDDVADRLTTMIRLLTLIPVELPEEAGFALSVESAMNVTEDRVAHMPRSSATLNPRHGSIRVTADDATLTADLPQRAPEVARELAARLLAEYRSGRMHQPDNSDRPRF